MLTDCRYMLLGCITITLFMISCTKSYFKEFGEKGNKPSVAISVQRDPFEFSIGMQVRGSFTSTRPLPDSVFRPFIVVKIPENSGDMANSYLESFMFDRMIIAPFGDTTDSAYFVSDNYPMKCLLGPCIRFWFEDATIGDQVDSVSVTAFYQYHKSPGEPMQDSVKATLYRIEGHFKTEIWLD